MKKVLTNNEENTVRGGTIADKGMETLTYSLPKKGITEAHALAVLQGHPYKNEVNIIMEPSLPGQPDKLRRAAGRCAIDACYQKFPSKPKEPTDRMFITRNTKTFGEPGVGEYQIVCRKCGSSRTAFFQACNVEPTKIKELPEYYTDIRTEYDNLRNVRTRKGPAPTDSNPYSEEPTTYRRKRGIRYTYRYTNRMGEPLSDYYKIILKNESPIAGHEHYSEEFGLWIKEQPDESKRVLYRAHLLEDALWNEGHPLIIAEGEKDVASLIRLGFKGATTNANGSFNFNGYHFEEVRRLCKEDQVKVYIIQDTDLDGLKRVNRLGAALIETYELNPKDIFMITNEVLGFDMNDKEDEGKDITDFINEFPEEEQASKVQEILDSAPQWQKRKYNGKVYLGQHEISSYNKDNRNSEEEESKKQREFRENLDKFPIIENLNVNLDQFTIEDRLAPTVNTVARFFMEMFGDDILIVEQSLKQQGIHDNLNTAYFYGGKGIWDINDFPWEKRLEDIKNRMCREMLTYAAADKDICDYRYSLTAFRKLLNVTAISIYAVRKAVSAVYYSHIEKELPTYGVHHVNIQDLRTKLRYIGTASGVVDLHENKLLPDEEAKKLYITGHISTRYNPEANVSLVYEKLLKRGPFEQREILMKRIAYHLIRGPAGHFYEIVGDTGGGKSTFFNCLEATLHPLVSAPPKNSMNDTKFNPGHEDFLDYFMSPYRLAILSEPSPREKNTEILKSASSGSAETKTYRRAYGKGMVEGLWSATMFFVYNEESGNNLGLHQESLARRLQYIPFAPLEPQDIMSVEKVEALVASPEVREALFYQLCLYCADVAKNGKPLSDIIDKATKERIEDVNRSFKDYAKFFIPEPGFHTPIEYAWAGLSSFVNGKLHPLNLVSQKDTIDGVRYQGHNGLTKALKKEVPHLKDREAKEFRLSATENGYKDTRIQHLEELLKNSCYEDGYSQIIEKNRLRQRSTAGDRKAYLKSQKNRYEAAKRLVEEYEKIKSSVIKEDSKKAENLPKNL